MLDSKQPMKFGPGQRLKDYLHAEERRVLLQALHQAEGNVLDTADLLGVSRAQVYLLMKVHRIARKQNTHVEIREC